MLLRKWNDLPNAMKKNEIKEYYDILSRKRGSLLLKRVFDIIMSFSLLVLFAPGMILIALLIKIDSKGSVFFRQERITRYGRKFKIHKFRTMIENANIVGAQITAKDDKRITRVGYILRKFRIDEIPQLIDVLEGNMSFVGTRPEVVKYVKAYTPKMRATLLMPAGITSQTSIIYKNESELLDGADDIDNTYINKVLPEKMKYNLLEIKKFSVLRDFKIMIQTVLAVLKQ